MRTDEPADPAIIVCPEEDDNPAPDFTTQERCVAFLHANLTTLFADQPDVDIAVDRPWYAREDEATAFQTPNVSIVFGLRRGPRAAYLQWEEGDIPVHVAFDVFPRETLFRDKGRKFLYYHDRGIEEYYTFDLTDLEFRAYVRSPLKRTLIEVRNLDAFVSPRMGVRFATGKDGITISHPNRGSFGTLADALNQRDEARRMMHRIARLSSMVLGKEATDKDRAELERLILRSEHL